MSNIVLAQVSRLAQSLNLEGDPKELTNVLKATAFKGEVSDAQMAALLVVANQYKLNPWTKEIYAFPDKSNGIVPVVGVDGWSRILNDNHDFDGMEFRQSDTMVRMPGAKSDAPEWMECVIYRKSRSKPIVVREYLDEVYREPFKGKYGDVIGPWQTHPKRFLRHKTMIQAGRIAFGYGGIYDQDEAERIAESQAQQPHTVNMGPAVEVVPPPPPQQPEWPADRWAAGLPKWIKGIADGKPLDEVLAWLKSKGRVTAEQEQQLRAEAAKVQAQQQAPAPAAPAAAGAPTVDAEQLAQRMQACTDTEALYELGNLMDAVTDPEQNRRLGEIFDAKLAELEQAP